MAVAVKTGEIYPAKTLKSGMGKKGAWALLKVKAEKGYDEIDIWATNAEELKNPQAVKVVSIDSAQITNQKSPDGTKWYTHYSINAKLSPIAGHSNGDEWVTPEEDLEDIFKL